MLQRSDFLTRLAAACSELCMACVRICERMSDDPMMEDCAEVCRLAAESCRKLGPYQA
jgi:hypothetical protein